MKNPSLLTLGILLGLAACKEADSTVLVNISINPDVRPVHSVRVAMSSAQARDTKTYPAKASATALPSGSSLVIILPRSRTGRLDLAVVGIDNAGANVAHGATQATIAVGGSVTAAVVLAAGPSLCGNMALDSGETCDDGNQFSFDGCDFQCQPEGSRPDAAAPDSGMPEVIPNDGATADTRIDDVFSDRLADVRGADTVGDLPAPSDLPVTTSDLAREAAQDSAGDVHIPFDTPVASDAADVRFSTDMGPDAETGPAKDAASPADTTPICSPQPKSTGGIPCPGGQCALGGYSGPAFTATDGVMSTVCMSPNSLCAAGQTPAYSATTNSWGGDFGFETTTAFPILSGAGVAVALSSLPTSQTIRVNVLVQDTVYCAAMMAANQTIPWKDFYTECWNTGGTSLGTLAPTTAMRIYFVVNSTTVAGTFDFCVTSLALVQPKLPLGTRCTSGAECESTFCADGVCCGVASCTTPDNTCSTCSGSTNGVPDGRCGARCPICNCVSGNCSC
jgi:cysteine-rich repeat protein